MSLPNVPAPGGPVTPLRFGVMALGAAAGIQGFNNFILPKLPPRAIQWSLFGFIPGYVVWYGAAALLGGAGASMAFSKMGPKS